MLPQQDERFGTLIVGKEDNAFYTPLTEEQCTKLLKEGLDFTFFQSSKNIQTSVHLTFVPFYATVPSSPISHSFHYVPVIITRRRAPFLFQAVFPRPR